jgi:ubiquinone/menaquinone biosynthesis C-methylase UbiE
MKPDVFGYYLLNRPWFLSLIRATELDLYHHSSLLTGKVLDFGCGDGFFTHCLKKYNWLLAKNSTVYGLDVHQNKLREAKQYAFYQRLTHYDGATIPFSSNWFDGGLANCVFEHIPDLKGSLKELKRVLKKGKQLHTTVMTNQWENYLLLPKKYWRTKQNHWHLLTVKQWEEIFNQSGLTVVYKQGYFDRQQTRLMELGHFWSLPYLLAYRFTGNWSVLGPVYKALTPLQKIAAFYSRPVSLSQAAAAYFVLQS